MKLKMLDLEQAGKVYEYVSAMPRDENGFATEFAGCTREEFERLVERAEKARRGEGLPEGWVPQTQYILWNDEDIPVGMFHFRQHLCPSLRQRSGHIGYTIREGYRGRGYATEGLRLMIEEAKKTVPEPELLIGALKSNKASLAVQKKHGAIPLLETEDYLLSRIPLERTQIPVVAGAESPFFDVDGMTDGEVMLKVEELCPVNPEKGWLPAYHFFICLPDGTRIGTCDLRLGHNEKTYYGGNIGYAVDEPYRGHHYAAKAVSLIRKLAARHGMDFVIITCDWKNAASARTCELAGCKYIETVDLPEYNDMYQQGMRKVMIWQLMTEDDGMKI